MIDIQWRAKYEGKSDMVLEDQDVGLEFSKTAQAFEEYALNKIEYVGEWLHIG